MKRDNTFKLYKCIIDEVPGFWKYSKSIIFKNENNYWCSKSEYPHPMVFIFDHNDVYLGEISWDSFDKYFILTEE
jgi:hypothetical protein